MRDLFEQLRRRILNLDTAIREEYKKLYIAYKMTTNIVDIEPQKKRLRLMLNMPFEDVYDPKALCRDVTNLGHYSSGNVEVGIASLDQLDDAMDLIRQSFERHWEESESGWRWCEPFPLRVPWPSCLTRVGFLHRPSPPCHSERSEESLVARRFFAALRMTGRGTRRCKKPTVERALLWVSLEKRLSIRLPLRGHGRGTGCCTGRRRSLFVQASLRGCLSR